MIAYIYGETPQRLFGGRSVDRDGRNDQLRWPTRVADDTDDRRLVLYKSLHD